MIVLRPATMDDAEFLLSLRNEPRVRAMSGNTEEIALGAHLAWMHKRLELASQHLPQSDGLYVLQYGKLSIGMGRIDCEDPGGREMRTCSLHYAVDAPWRCKGYGRQLIALLVKEAQAMGYQCIKVRIKRENTASIICAAVGGVNAVEFL